MTDYGELKEQLRDVQWVVRETRRRMGPLAPGTRERRKFERLYAAAQRRFDELRTEIDHHPDAPRRDTEPIESRMT